MPDVVSSFAFSLNGRTTTVRDAPSTRTLLEHLRLEGHTGTKEGCAEGDCGACSVALLEDDAHGRPRYRAINSCLTLLPMVAGRTVLTAEGLAGPDANGVEGLHPVQQCMVDSYGSQCGYCTPGFVMSLFEAYHRDDCHAVAEIDDQLAGNLCRCTGYRPIRDAALAACSQRGRDRFEVAPTFGAAKAELTSTAASGLRYQASTGQRFFRPTTLSELFAIWSDHPEAQLVAGATDLGLGVTKRYERPKTLLSLEAVRELLAFGETPESEGTRATWRIGAAVSLTQVEERLSGAIPALQTMLRWFGSRQIRNRATVGGNLANASPIGDLAPMLLAWDATVTLASARGNEAMPVERDVRLAEFFLGYRKTALAPQELLKTITLPKGAATGSGGPVRRRSQSYKVSRRRDMDISIVASCFVIDTDPEGAIVHARLGYGGVAATPMRATAVEAALVGKPWSLDAVQSVLPLLNEAFSPISDHRGSAHYRARLITTLFERFYAEHPASALPAAPAAHDPIAGGSL